MALIQWEPRFNVGVAEIDQEHRQIVDKINSLHEAMAGGENRDRVPRLVDEATNCTLLHFAHEEEMMQQYRYPDYEMHKEIHDEFVASLAEVRKLQAENKLPDLQILDILKSCLIDHIVNSDCKYAQFMQGTNAH